MCSNAQIKIYILNKTLKLKITETTYYTSDLTAHRKETNQEENNLFLIVQKT